MCRAAENEVFINCSHFKIMSYKIFNYEQNIIHKHPTYNKNIKRNK